MNDIGHVYPPSVQARFADIRTITAVELYALPSSEVFQLLRSKDTVQQMQQSLEGYDTHDSVRVEA